MKKILLGIIAILFSFNGWAESEPKSNVCNVDFIDAWGIPKGNHKILHQYVDILENCTEGQNLHILSTGKYFGILLASYCDLNSKFHLGTPPATFGLTELYQFEPPLINAPNVDGALICVFTNHGNGHHIKERYPLK